MSLRTPEKVEKLQVALHAKAKGSPDDRFYALYIERPATRTGVGAARKGLRSRRCWRTSPCVGSSWGGRSSGTSRACGRGWSPMRTIS